MSDQQRERGWHLKLSAKLKKTKPEARGSHAYKSHLARREEPQAGTRTHQEGEESGTRVKRSEGKAEPSTWKGRGAQEEWEVEVLREKGYSAGASSEAGD